MFIVEMWGIPRKQEPGDKYDNRCFKCHGNFWDAVSKLGRENGWQPMGTLPSDPDILQKFIEWGSFNPDYEPDDYARSKLVLAKDANAWAAALEKALNIDAQAKFESEKLPALLRDEMTEEDFLKANRGISKEHIQDFISFLKKGGFGFAWDD